MRAAQAELGKSDQEMRDDPLLSTMNLMHFEVDPEDRTYEQYIKPVCAQESILSVQFSKHEHLVALYTFFCVALLSAQADERSVVLYLAQTDNTTEHGRYCAVSDSCCKPENVAGK